MSKAKRPDRRADVDLVAKGTSLLWAMWDERDDGREQLEKLRLGLADGSVKGSRMKEDGVSGERVALFSTNCG